MSDSQYSKDFLEFLYAIKNKRARVVALHIVENGFVTTEQLQELYGYKHPPRAARDLRELGIPLETTRVKDSSSRSIAAYRFGDPDEIANDRLAGRRVISKHFKQLLIDLYGSRCHICQTPYDARYLQIDHRVPYQVAGDDSSNERNPDDYMLICGECNRAKSWSCEHCLNWQQDRLIPVCLTCYWANPEAYKHIALREIRRVELVWSDDEIENFTQLQSEAEQRHLNLAEYIKERLQRINKGD